jgi:quercetin dioxygenase-like cupin family protein
MREALLRDIADYCRHTRMAESTFGRLAVNDGKLVNRLRLGGRVTTETEDRVRAFITRPRGTSRLRASRVSFTPGGRTNWHTHAVGQVLYVLTGVGRYQALGGPVQVILPGDTVIIPPGLKHWHGAAPDHQMAHLAMSETSDKGEATTWLEPVSDADYNKAPA